MSRHYRASNAPAFHPLSFHLGFLLVTQPHSHVHLQVDRSPLASTGVQGISAAAPQQRDPGR